MLTKEEVQDRAQTILDNPAQALAEVMAAHPTLSAEGMGNVGFRNKWPGDEFAKYRQVLADDLDEFVAAVKWCAANMTPTRSFVRSARHYVTSYGQKHTMESDTDTYVTNGTYIAAMLALGFRATDDYNPYFNARMKSDRTRRREAQG